MDVKGAGGMAFFFLDDQFVSCPLRERMLCCQWLPAGCIAIMYLLVAPNWTWPAKMFIHFHFILYLHIFRSIFFHIYIFPP